MSAAKLAELDRRVTALERATMPPERSRNGTGWDGRCIREAREAAGWTAAGLAEALGVSASAVCSYEQGTRKVPIARVREINALFVQAGHAPPRFVG